MIQAPQTQYIPAQQLQTTYPQQGAYNPVQYNQTQTPGVIYNYPTASSYMPASQPYYNDRQQYNGVNIEILNPQGQGAVPQCGYQIPAQYMPVQQPVIIPQYQTQAPVQYMPVQQPVMTQTPMPVSQAVVQAPQTETPNVIQQPVQQIPAPQIVSSPVSQEPAAAQQVQAPVVEQPVALDSSVTPEAFAGKLKADDLNAQKEAIEEVAELVKNDETAGPILLDTQIFDALVDIIDKDTTELEGPSSEIIELREKPQEELSEEEIAKASAPSPLEQAEINKQYALYTISYMQERLNNELEKRNGQALELKDLPCIEKVIDTAKSNPNPMLRIGAIASLSHIARPEYKEDLSTIFELAKSDEDARVQESAAKAIEALG